MTEIISPIPSRLKNVAVGGHVAGADQIIDDEQNKDQETINAELYEAIGTGGSVDTKIANAINALDATASKTAGADGLTLSVTEVDGKVTQINGSIAANTYAPASDSARITSLETAVGSGGSVDSRISSAVATETTRAQGAESTLQTNINAEATRAQAAEADRYTKSETYSKQEVNGMITTPEQDYVSVEATPQTAAATDVLPATGEADTIYRVGNWDGSAYEESCYTEYTWNTNTDSYIKLAVKSNDVYTKDGGYDLSLDDETGNSVVLFDNGHVRTKKFDSSRIVKNENSENDLEISDETDYSVLMIKDGYPKTKNFDGRIIKRSVSDIDNRTKIVEELDLYETVVVNIADYDNNLMNVYAAISPTKQKHYTILIPEGTYNVNEWFTQAQIENSNETHWRGLELMDYTKLLGLGASDKVILQWINPDSATHWGYISVLNTNHWHELENLTIKANNIRYAVHDDLWDGQDRFIRAKNCNFIVSGNTTRCWGAGTNGGYEGVFEHCKFIMDLYEPFIQSDSSIHPFSLHDNSYNVGRDSHVKMVNCVFYTPYTERLRYWSSSWEQVEYNASYPVWDNEKLDYAINECVNTPEDPEHSYKCLYAGSQVPPCIKGRESFGFGYRSSEATGYLYASIENCECNTYLEVCEVKERLTGFCNIWGHVPVLYQESADNKFVIMDFRNQFIKN